MIETKREDNKTIKNKSLTYRVYIERSYIINTTKYLNNLNIKRKYVKEVL